MNFKRYSLLWVGVVVLIIVVLAFPACTGTKTTQTSTSVTTQTTATTKAPLKLGLLLDKTGFIAFAGLDAEKGITVGLEEIGYKVNGQTIQVIIEDAASDAGPSLDKIKKMVEQDHVNIVMGPVNGGGDQAVFHYLSEAGIPRLGVQPCDVPDDWDRSKPYTTFAVHGSGQSMAYVMGAYAYDVLGYKTTTMLTADFIAGHLFTEGFARGFKARGGKVINEVMYPVGTQDMVPYYLKLDKSADFICTWWPGSDGFVGFKQYKELGLKIPIVQPEDGGLSASPTALAELGDSTTGCVSCAVYSYMVKNPGNDNFIKMFQAKYKELPGVFCGAGYANIQVLSAVMKAAGGDTSPQALMKAIRALDLMTITGPVKFPDPGHNIGTYTPMVFRINAKHEPEVIGLPVVNEKWTPGGGRLQDQYIVTYPK
jgi:branched-chain amino acid transport system substrate-binding protein